MSSSPTSPKRLESLTMRSRNALALLFVLCLVTPALAQQEMRSNSKGSSIPLPITGTSIDSNHNALDTTLNTLLACERLQSSAANGHCVVIPIAKLTVISTTSAVTIGGGVADDTYLIGIRVLAALTGTCVVAGFPDSAGAAQSFTLPATFVGSLDLGGVKNSAGALTITCSNAADDNLVLVRWWPAS